MERSPGSRRRLWRRLAIAAMILGGALISTMAPSTLFGIAAEPAAEADDGQASGRVLRIGIEGDIINPASAEYIISAIDRANVEHAACLVLELDTPGGLMTSTRAIVRKILASSVPIVTFVSPAGAQAGSAGVFITLASHVAAMAPSTNIGAAHPVGLTGAEAPNPAEEEAEGKALEKATGVMEEKTTNDARAWAASLASMRGRNVEWAEKAVVESATATAEEAVELRVVDLMAAGLPELLKQIDGRTVKLASGEAQLRTAGASVTDFPENFRLRLLTAIAHPNIAYILLMLGFYGLLFEITHPGVGISGVAGAISLILAFFALAVLPTNFAGVALIVLGIALFIAEIKITSYGLLTLGGLAALIAGSLLLFETPHDFMRVSLPLILAFSLATLAVALFLGGISARLQRRRAATGAEGMTGEHAAVVSWEGSAGKVFVHGERWDARGPAGLAVGDEVVVKGVAGMTLEVERKASR